MHKIVFYIQLLILATLLTSCEEESEELQLNDLVNQEYEAKKNRFFAATVGFEEFETNKVELDSINGHWIIWASSENEQLKLYLPFLKEQVFWGNDSNNVEILYKKSGGEWHRSNWSKKEPYSKIEITRMDTALNQLFGKFEGRLYNESAKHELFVDQGVFNRLQYQIE